MSSLPGLTLEYYLMWLFDLIVDGDGSANAFLQIAEAIGVSTRRTRISGLDFAPIVRIYEPMRECIENTLAKFDEDSMSWRDYAIACQSCNPPEIYSDANSLVNVLRRAAQSETEKF